MTSGRRGTSRSARELGPHMVATGFSITSTKTGRTEMTRTRAICVNAGLPLRSALPGRRSASDQRSGFETGRVHPS